MKMKTTRTDHDRFALTPPLLQSVAEGAPSSLASLRDLPHTGRANEDPRFTRPRNDDMPFGFGS